jgi:hypothetical protein
MMEFAAGAVTRHQEALIAETSCWPRFFRQDSLMANTRLAVAEKKPAGPCLSALLHALAILNR